MKVLHVIPSVSERSGGPSHAIVEMCRSLQRQGTEVLIATTDHGIVSSFEFQVSSSTSTDARDSESSMPNNQSLTRNSKLGTRNYYKGVPTLFFPFQWGESFKYSRQLASWLDAHVAEFDLVHIHAVFNHACLTAARACRKHGAPYVVRPLGTLDPWSMKQKPLRKRLFWHVTGKRMLRSAAAVHYTAFAEQQAVEESLGLNHGAVIPLGIDREFFSKPDGGAGFLRDFPLLNGHPYVLVLSRLHPKKGLDVLVKAFLKLTAEEQFAQWRLVVAGDGPKEYVAMLKKLVSDNGATHCVLFTGWLGNTRKLSALHGASILALPSYQENFGLCVMEAMACGVPVLISPQVNLAEEVEAAGAGWVAPVETDALTRALAEALRDEGQRVARGRAGYKLAQTFSWDHCASKLGILYKAITA